MRCSLIKLRSVFLCRGAAKPAPKKPAVKLDPGEKHRALFDLRDGVLGPEYAASGVHVPRHIQEEVAKAFCMQKRRAHVETLKAFAAARAEQARVAREAELMARAKQMMAGKGTARGGPAEVRCFLRFASNPGKIARHTSRLFISSENQSSFFHYQEWWGSRFDRILADGFGTRRQIC